MGKRLKDTEREGKEKRIRERSESREMLEVEEK